MSYQTEEEQVEALKTWWKENGKSIMVGAVLGFSIIFGWQGWQIYQVDQGEAASQRFDDLQKAVETAEQDELQDTAKQLMDEHASSAYASFAVLQLAKQAYENGDKAQVREHLEWVLQNASDTVIQEMARLRLGRLLLDMQDSEAAKTLLAQATTGLFSSEFMVLQGDLAYQAGDLAAARKAYQEALEAEAGDVALLRMKLADIAAEGQG